MVRIRTLLSSVMALALLSSSAYAADKTGDAALVKVRGSDKGDYSRLVFDWEHLPKYTATQTGTGLTIKFDAPADFKTTGTEPTKISRITGYKIVSPDTVQIDFAPNETIRHFVIDNRLVIDIKGDATSDTKTAGEEKQVAKIEPAAAEKEPVKAQTEKKEIKQEIPAAESTAKEEADKPVNLVKTIEAVPDEHASPVATAAVPKEPEKLKLATVSITSTESISLAVFERAGYLWVVESKDSVKIPPQISGDTHNELGPFDPVPAVGLSAFRAKMPSGVMPVVTGGGLVWKMTFRDKLPPDKKPTPLERQYTDVPQLLWPVKDIERVADIIDPDVGDTLRVGLVESAKGFFDTEQHFVDVDVLPSFAGLVVAPKSDGVTVSKTPEGIKISKPDGLLMANEKDVLSTNKSEKPDAAKTKDNQEISRIFDFEHWQIGTKKELSDNQRLIMSTMADQTDSKKTENLIGLARLVLSFDYAPEAMGYLDLAQSRVPDLDSNPEFMALRGAAEALSWKYKDAFRDFSMAGLNDIGEIPYWKSFTLAKLDDWQQAAKTLPDDVSILSNYPEDILNPVATTLAEVALREGNVKKAKAILDILEPSRDKMSLPYASAFDYLKGEYARQTGKPDEAKKVWTDLTTGKDDLYRAKSRFALTMLQLGDKEITPDKAIDSLEGLRYAWRGDDLEVSINYNLAKAYLEKGEPVKALTMMKLAHSLNPESERGKQIDADMHDTFRNLFTPENVKKLSPIDAQTVYSEFSDLIPAGAEGDAIGRQLAERLVDADLLPRATAMLKKQINGDLQGAEGAGVAIRLAALQNMDGKPDDALQSLDKADLFLKSLSADEVLPKQRDIGMLRAQAYSMKNKLDDAFAALALLPQDDGVLRLRADIAWRGKKWQDAADSLEQLVQNQEISLTRPLSDAQADLILNWAVALYLADNRYVLANLRERYSDAMAATAKADKFEVVTRPRQAALLADRETINSIIDETVIFKDFLKSFKATDIPSSPRVVPAQKTAEPPAEDEKSSRPVPQGLRNIPGLKTDEVLGD